MYIVATLIIVSQRGLFLLYAGHILLVGRWRRILCAFDVETSVSDINFTRPPQCILGTLGLKWVYWMLVSTSFLYDKYISDSRTVFVSSCQEDRNICHAMGCGADVRLSMCIVLVRLDMRRERRCASYLYE